VRTNYKHTATEPDRSKPVIMCSFCNEQGLLVMSMHEANKIFILCTDCDYEWEWNTKTLEWEGYSLEGGRWEHEDG
jgi:transcription elongation factor Elf1